MEDARMLYSDFCHRLTVLPSHLCFCGSVGRKIVLFCLCGHLRLPQQTPEQHEKL
jgi:hypothetical protein